MEKDRTCDNGTSSQSHALGNMYMWHNPYFYHHQQLNCIFQHFLIIIDIFFHFLLLVKAWKIYSRYYASTGIDFREILHLLTEIWRNYGSKMTEIGTAPLFMDGLWRIIWHTKAIVKTYPAHFPACQMDLNSACYSRFTSLVTHITFAASHTFHSNTSHMLCSVHVQNWSRVSEHFPRIWRTFCITLAIS